MAVCNFEVVAPPTIMGILKPAFCISSVTCTISPSEGVIKPEGQTRSGFSSIAFFTITSAGTITPKSITS